MDSKWVFSVNLSDLAFFCKLPIYPLLVIRSDAKICVKECTVSYSQQCKIKLVPCDGFGLCHVKCGALWTLLKIKALKDSIEHWIEILCIVCIFNMFLALCKYVVILNYCNLKTSGEVYIFKVGEV